MKPLLIVKTGTTVPEVRERRGDFEAWIGEGLRADALTVAFPIEVASVFEGDALPAASSLAGVIVTGSSAMVSEREPWSERTAAWLVGVLDAEVPLFGICYGHQLLAHAVGGRVGPNPLGREIGTVAVEFCAARGAQSDALLGGFGSVAHFNVSHVESVLELPAGARRLARSVGDPNQAFALGRRAWGVQFHPEFDADVMRGYLAARRAVLGEEGLDADALTAAVRDTPAGPRLLARFGALVAADAD